MPTFKYEIRKDRLRQDGTYSVRIRVTQNKKVKYIPTSLSVDKNDLTRTSLIIKNPYIIKSCEDIIVGYRNKCNAIGGDLKNWDVDRVCRLILDDEQSFRLSFIEFGREYVDSIRHEHKGNAGNIMCALNSFERFVGCDIDVNDIAKATIQGYVSSLKGNRAPSLYYNCLRRVFRAATDKYNDEDRQIINIKYNPFKGVAVNKGVIPETRALSVDKIRMIFDFPYSETSSRINIAKDVYILSFCLIGMNSVDLYRLTDFDGDYITYERSKTKDKRSDNALIKVRVRDEIKFLFEKYKGVKGVFDFSKRYAGRNEFSQALNKGLKKIGEVIGEPNLQFYSARHSWATIARNECGIDKFTIAQCLNHSAGALEVTDRYIKRDWGIIDNANDKVLDLIFGR